MNPRDDHQYEQKDQNSSEIIRSSSMTTLIIWNIKKALEKNPKLELKTALRSAQKRLENKVTNVSAIVSQRADERHLSCALLAWQHLGHNHADSLHSFAVAQLKVVPKQETYKCGGSWGTFDSSKKTSCNVPAEKSYVTHKESESVESPLVSGVIGSSGYPSLSMGPVLKLPATPKMVIPVYNVQGGCGGGGGGAGGVGGCGGGGLRKAGQDIKSKIEKACCLETSCVQRLATLDSETKALRQRLAQLARRETERIELLEKAESAWKDLEMRYIRRHRAHLEKEEDIVRKSAKLIEDRNSCKDACAKLVQVLKPRGETAETARKALKKLEATVCSLACDRIKIVEAAHKETTALTELQSKSNQQDRDLLFKEEKIRRKKSTAENDLESTRGLMFEEERTLEAELKGYKEQIKDVSAELFEEDAVIEKTKKERDELLEEKMELTEDLEGCQAKCDKYMQKRIDELKEKRENLKALKEKVLECKCKFPMETGVQVQRTASLAALCYCSPRERALKSCSCTSLRSTLLSDLFTNLFAGLKTEMGETSLKMPCQLLKCLEDSHNWDRTTVIKTNLRSFFAKLLCGELEIAIINSIEKYHAQWIGASCADYGRPIPDVGGADLTTWEDRLLAEKAQWMAQSMAENMFKEREKEIMDEAKKIVKAGPPPCTCKPPKSDAAAVYQCIVQPNINRTETPTAYTPIYDITSDDVPEMDSLHVTKAEREIVSVSTSTQKKRPVTSQKCDNLQKESIHRRRSCYECSKSDVVLLRAQIENLKRESLKKQDLKLIEETIRRLVERASGSNISSGTHGDDINNPIVPVNNRTNANGKLNKNNSITMKIKKRKTENVIDKIKINRHYAVNMCLCGSQRDPTNTNKQQSVKVANDQSTKSEQEAYKNLRSVIATKPDKSIEHLPLKENRLSKRNSCNSKCGKKCCCFNKKPSCSSINNFLDTLTKWKFDLTGYPTDNTETGNILVQSKTKANNEPACNDLSTIVYHSTMFKDDLKRLSELLDSSYKKCEDTDDHLFEGKFKFPVTTESEYMGDVNLEKSYENICKCTIVSNDHLHNAAEHKNKMQSINLSEYKINDSDDKKADISERKIKSEDINQKKEEICDEKKIKSKDIFYRNNIIKEDTTSLQNKILTYKVSPADETFTRDKPVIQEIRKPVSSQFFDKNKNSEYFPQMCKNHKQEQCNFVNSNALKDRALNTTANLPCGCEYKIKLLGVTLTNRTPDKCISNNYTAETTEKKLYPPNLTSKDHADNVTSSLFSYPIKSMENYDLFKSEKTSTGLSTLEMPHCQCSSKFEQLRVSLNSANKGKPLITLEDKTLDTNSIKDEKDDQCVCCKKSVDQSNELEVNMFKLLKEHLRKKITTLNNNCESSYCIKPDEEKRIASRIFQKIKETIIETTGKIKCKCSEDAENEGSWQRAYNLLQEYLKIKISRVQCSCSLSDQNNEQSILPVLTDKVCNLIEKDFERLKDICKWKHDQKSTTQKPSVTEEIHLQLAEDDIDQIKKQKIEKYENNRKETASKELACCYLVATSNSAAQAIPISSTKSCGTVKTAEATIVTDTCCSNHEYFHVDETRCNNNNTLDEKVIKNKTKSSEHITNIVLDKCMIDTHSSVEECNQSIKSFDMKYDISDKKVINNQNSQYSNESQNLKISSQIDNPTTEKIEDILSKFKELEVELKSEKTVKDNTKSKSLPYIGYTINCTCAPNLGFCVCSKSRVIENSDFISNLWSACTKSKVNNINTSYIMEKSNINKKTQPISEPPVIMTDIDTNTKAKVIFTLKDSTEKIGKLCKQDGTNTNEPKISIIRHEYEFPSETTPAQHKKKSVHFLYRSKSEVITTYNLQTPESSNIGCDCSKVPVCHVKMLVKDIETKLANSECTCDSLISKVCPVHSKIDG